MKNARVIYKRLTEPMKKRGYINLNHRLVNTKDDLIEIAEIFRNTNYETFRIIYMKDNKIAGYESISSRTPNFVQIFKEDKNGRTNTERCIYKILERMNRLQANGYYMVHNHVNGSAKASKEDLKTTVFFINKIQGFLGHLIINSETYGWISYDDDTKDLKVDNDKSINKRKARNMKKRLDKNSSIYDIKILSRDDLVSVLTNIKNSPDYSIAILTDSKGKIRMILDIPNHFMNMQKEQLKGYFKNLSRMSGSCRVFFGTNDNDTYKKAVEHQIKGTFKDCICLKNEEDRIYVYERSDLVVESELFDKNIKVSEEEQAYNKQTKKIKVLYKKVGKRPEIKMIDNTLEAKQKLVGGLIEVVPYEDVLIICNEEGKIHNMPPNIVFDYDYIAGNCIIVGDDYEHGDFKSLSDNEITKYKNDIMKRSFKIINYDEEEKYSSKLDNGKEER